MTNIIHVGSTPTITFSLPFEVGKIAKFRAVFYVNYSRIITKENPDVTFEKVDDDERIKGTASIKFSQEESLLFPVNSKGKCQLHIKLYDGTVLTSTVMEYETSELLQKEAI